MRKSVSPSSNVSLPLIRWVARVMLPVLLAAFVTAGAIRALAHDRLNLPALLDCATGDPICLLGIVPGETSADAVIALLHNHDWVDEFQRRRGMDMDSGLIVWTWSGRQHPAINPRIEGRLWYEDSLVRYVDVPLHVGLGDIWLALGVPETGRLFRTSGGVDGYVSVGFRNTQVLAIATVDCPLAARVFWRESVVLRVHDERSAAASRISGPYQPPVWGQCV